MMNTKKWLGELRDMERRLDLCGSIDQEFLGSITSKSKSNIVVYAQRIVQLH